VSLDAGSLAAIEAAVPKGAASGGRYADFLLADMVTERTNG
jgi:hypothetical protein